MGSCINPAEQQAAENMGPRRPKEETKEDCDSCNNIDFSTPMNAFTNGKREKLLYTTATRTDNVESSDAGDFLAVVDVDPQSKTYCQIIGQVDLGKGEEVHHSGWNACASCYGMNGVKRKYLVVPSFTSGNVHFVDVSNGNNPTLHKVCECRCATLTLFILYPLCTDLIGHAHAQIMHEIQTRLNILYSI